MRYVLLFLIIPFAWAADPVPKLPPDVQKIVDSREAEVAKAKAVYDAAVQKATQAASKQVEAVVKAKTQKGDLDGALAGKAVLDKWNGEAGDLLGEKKDFVVVNKTTVSVWIVGKWNFTRPGYNGVWEFTKSGEVDTGGPAGKYTLDTKIVTVTWPSGRTETVNVASDLGDKTTGMASNGIPFTITRVR